MGRGGKREKGKIFGYFSALKNIICSNASESDGAEKK